VDLWCPFADRHEIPGQPGTGSMLGGQPKIVHHSTEGDGIAGAIATYAKTGDLPHFTDTFEGGRYRVVQHLPLNVAATALKHPPGTGATNRDNVIQIEHVGHAATSSGWPVGYLDEIAVLCRWIELQTGCARAVILPFIPGGMRLPWSVWHSSSGHCGHMHVPFNDHVDPGAMDIGHVLSAGQQPTPPPAPPAPVPPLDLPGEDDMTLQLLTIDAGELDGQGNGGILFDGGKTDSKGMAQKQEISWASVRCVELGGSFPPDDGYRALPQVGRQQRNGFLFVEMWGGAPKAPVTLLVTVAA
jgi:hypothetical protein